MTEVSHTSRTDLSFPAQTSISFPSAVRAMLIVAHPDDETLWAGGLILMHPHWRWGVVSVSRGDDPDRSARFSIAMRKLGCEGFIGVLNDGPEQAPLSDISVREAIMSLLRGTKYDLIITHSPYGEYTRHRRHEELGRAVLGLWQKGVLVSQELWLFAYTDNGKKHYPRAIDGAHLSLALPHHIWSRKLAVMLEEYGFTRWSWEGMTVPRTEAFWCLRRPEEALVWMNDSRIEPTPRRIVEWDVGRREE